MSIFNELVPKSGNLSVDWPAMEQAFGWFRAMHNCSQEPKYHGEGDVQIHTKMVVEALLDDPAWQALPEAERQSLFWAALLHDVAKPHCTREIFDGRIISPGHAWRGQIMARLILWRMAIPLAQRELICHLITHHLSPFHLINNDGAERRIHLISHQTRCDLLAILAYADAMGRICDDQNRLLENIALFKELCIEQECLTKPKRFASDHSRFLYFRKTDRAAEYEAYDDWHGEVVLLSGLPASGKDTWLAKNANGRKIISLDDLRNELGVDPGGNQGKVIAAAREQARQALRNKRNFIWNATNISHKLRAQLIDLFAAYKAHIHIVYLEASETELTRRNNSRTDIVPQAAITRMQNRWQPPDLTECHKLTICIT